MTQPYQPIPYHDPFGPTVTSSRRTAPEAPTRYAQPAPVQYQRPVQQPPVQQYAPEPANTASDSPSYSPRLFIEIGLTALFSGIGIAALSWASDKLCAHFLPTNYELADPSLHVTSGIIAAVAVVIFFAFYFVFIKNLKVAKGLYSTAVGGVVVVSGAYILLTSLSVYTIVYLVLILGVVIPLSYIPSLVESNRYVS